MPELNKHVELHMEEKKICSRCIMDSSIPDIVFDENGMCNYCKEYEKKAALLFSDSNQRREKRNELLARIKEEGKNKEYDCIIGLSGGVDSTYVAYLTKKFGLRPLAIHLDNGWNSELSVANIKQIVKLLDIDLYTHVMDWEEFKDLQLSFLKSSVTNIEIPTDHAISALLFKRAAEENIRHIISGNNFATEAIQPSIWGEYNKDLRLIEGIHKQFGTKKLKTFPKISLIDYFYYTVIRRIKQIPLLDYVDYNKKEAVKILQDELCWKNYGAKHYESIFTRFFQGYILMEKYNVDKRLGHLSSLIMSGQMTREDALEEMRLPAYPDDLLHEDREYFLKKLDLSEETFNAIMTTPIKSNKDYPSNAWIFKNFSFLIQTIKRFATT